MSIHERMIAILDALPAIGKNQRNEQQRFMFRGHDDILNALNPLLATHGVYVVPDVIERVTAQRTTAKGSLMYEVNLHVRFRFYGADGDCVEASTWGEGTDSGDKATNKAMTMAFKNVLNQAFAISSAEFQDADGSTPEETLSRSGEGENENGANGPSPDKPTEEQYEKLKELLQDLEEADSGVNWREVGERYIAKEFHAANTSQLSENDFERLLLHLGIKLDALKTEDVPIA